MASARGAPDAATLHDLATRLVRDYTASGRSLATSESLTGGLLGSLITSVAGASAIYRGGLICYATDVKALIGGVPAPVLGAHGAVSQPTASAMAANAAHRCQADIAIALTGVAGPDAQEGHLPGTVWLGWHTSDYPELSGTRLLRLSGDRTGVRLGAAAAAMGEALRILDGLGPTAQE